MGCMVKIDNGTLKILKGAMLVMKGLRKNSLYTLQGETIIGTSAVAAKDGDGYKKNWILQLAMNATKKF